MSHEKGPSKRALPQYASVKSLTKYGVRRKLLNLYEKLRDDASARQQFIANPSALLGKVFGLRLSSGHKVSEANRLLFSVLANPQFLNWHTEYTKANPKPERGQYRRDLAEALLKYGDRNILLAVVNTSAAGLGLPFLDGDDYSGNIPLAADLRSSQNFTQSSGESQRPTGLELDPRLSEVLVTIAQALVARANDLAQSGILSDPGAAIR